MSGRQTQGQTGAPRKRRPTWWPALVAIAVAAGLGVALRLAYLMGVWSPPWQTGNLTAQTPETQELPTGSVAHTEWDAKLSPEYYRVVGPAVVDVNVSVGEFRYTPLDELGRTVRAVGCIDFETMKAGIDRDRGELNELDPAGWGHNGWVDVQVPGGEVYHGFFWNRSHLIAKSLGGSDVVENLVCATRMQNVGANDGEGGMAYGEGLVRSWLFQHKKGWVYYSATPAYEGDDLVCRSVIVDIRSNDGSLDLELEVYNAALGYAIDYATGEFSQL